MSQVQILWIFSRVVLKSFFVFSYLKNKTKTPQSRRSLLPLILIIISARPQFLAQEEKAVKVKSKSRQPLSLSGYLVLLPLTCRRLFFEVDLKAVEREERERDCVCVWWIWVFIVVLAGLLFEGGCCLPTPARAPGVRSRRARGAARSLLPRSGNGLVHGGTTPKPPATRAPFPRPARALLPPPPSFLFLRPAARPARPAPAG